MKKTLLILFTVLISNVYYAQTYTLDATTTGTTITTCSGTFVDEGGNAGNYQNNSDYTITFCPATPGDVIKVSFSVFATEGTTSGCTDILEIYQGDASYAAPLIAASNPDDQICGTLTGVNLPVVYSTNTTSGCITFRFISDGSTRKAGWAASISCVTPCKLPTAALINSSIANICGAQSNNPGALTVNFDASNSTLGAYGVGGSTVSLASYNWVFGDGTTLSTSTPTTSHTYANTSGIYLAKLVVADNNTDINSSGCLSTNAASKLIRVLPAPTFTGTSSSPVNIGCGDNVTLNGVATSQTETQNTPAVAGVTVALPDGTGSSYFSNADFTGFFPSGATLSSSCYPTLYFTLEHSWSADLQIDLISPSGQTVRVFDRHGAGTIINPIAGKFGKCVNGLDNGAAGCGATYSVVNTGGQTWTNYASSAVITTTTSSCSGYTGTCESGNYYRSNVYTSTNSFAALNGSTMNGIWQLKVTDNLSQDDGVLFGWGLIFPQSCYGTLESVTPNITSGIWTNIGSGPAVPVSQPTSTVSVSSPGPDLCPASLSCVGSQLTNTINFGAFPSQGTFPYLYTATDEFGCTYSNTVNVSVSCACPTLTALSYGGPFCNSLTSLITPTVSGTGAISNGTYSSTPAGLSINSTTGVLTPSLSAANTYTVTYLVTPSTGTCAPIFVNTVVVINSTPTVIVTNTTVCEGGTVALTASGASSYVWDDGETTATILVTTNANSVYTVTGSTNGCSDTKTVSVSVVANPTVVVTNTAVCPGSSVTLMATGATTYSWSTGETTSIISVNPTSLSVYTVTGTDNGCQNTQTVSVTINPSPSSTVTATSTNSMITCSSPSVTLSAGATPVGAYSYSWSPVTGSSASINVGTAGVYTVLVTNSASGCSATAQYTVGSNITPPTVSSSNTVLPCGSPSIALTSTATNVTYSWTTISGSILSGSNTASPVVGSAGAYVLTVVDNTNGCSNTTTVNVTTTAVVAAFDANPTSGTAPLLVNFTNSSTGAVSYSWTFGDTNNNTSSSTDPNHIYTTNGTYVVTLVVSDALGLCSSTATISIEVFENSSIIIPNVFTPNGDKSNDIFKFKTVGIKDLTCDIFNRWGQKLYTIKDVTDSWDGGNSPDGTYFFMMKATGFDGKEYTQQGSINLFK